MRSRLTAVFVRDIQHSAYNLRLPSNIIELARGKFPGVLRRGWRPGRNCRCWSPPAQPVPGLLLSPSRPTEAFDPGGAAAGPLLARCQVGRVRVPPAKKERAPLVLERLFWEKRRTPFSPVRRPTLELVTPTRRPSGCFGIRNYRGRLAIRPLRGKRHPCDFLSQRNLAP